MRGHSEQERRVDTRVGNISGEEFMNMKQDEIQMQSWILGNRRILFFFLSLEFEFRFPFWQDYNMKLLTSLTFTKLYEPWTWFTCAPLSNTS